jgi:hypothetical protein
VLIAASLGEDGGRKLLILGLTEENIKRLLDDQPIVKNLGDEHVPGLEEWDVTILGPEDTARFLAAVAAQGVDTRPQRFRRE